MLQPLRNLVSLQPMVVELPHLQNLITSECSLWVQLNKYYNLTINLIFLLSKINLIHIWISYFNIPWLKLAKMRESAYLSSATLVHTLSLPISSFFSISFTNLAQLLSTSISVLNFKACWIWNLDFEHLVYFFLSLTGVSTISSEGGRESLFGPRWNTPKVSQASKYKARSWLRAPDIKWRHILFRFHKMWI